MARKAERLEVAAALSRSIPEIEHREVGHAQGVLRQLLPSLPCKGLGAGGGCVPQGPHDRGPRGPEGGVPFPAAKLEAPSAGPSSGELHALGLRSQRLVVVQRDEPRLPPGRVHRVAPGVAQDHAEAAASEGAIARLGKMWCLAHVSQHVTRLQSMTAGRDHMPLQCQFARLLQELVFVIPSPIERCTDAGTLCHPRLRGVERREMELVIAEGREWDPQPHDRWALWIQSADWYVRIVGVIPSGATAAQSTPY
mmetsp:Transcript_40554/g.128842  ORF Transcript_40554/g.128842 Transcript_40554/m.128842 type:complete len:253 (-) Transcript_40554:602-1360(-)